MISLAQKRLRIGLIFESQTYLGALQTLLQNSFPLSEIHRFQTAKDATDWRSQNALPATFEHEVWVVDGEPLENNPASGQNLKSLRDQCLAGKSLILSLVPPEMGSAELQNLLSHGADWVAFKTNHIKEQLPLELTALLTIMNSPPPAASKEPLFAAGQNPVEELSIVKHDLANVTTIIDGMLRKLKRTVPEISEQTSVGHLEKAIPRLHDFTVRLGKVRDFLQSLNLFSPTTNSLQEANTHDPSAAARSS